METIESVRAAIKELETFEVDFVPPKKITRTRAQYAAEMDASIVKKFARANSELPPSTGECPLCAKARPDARNEVARNLRLVEFKRMTAQLEFMLH